VRPLAVARASKQSRTSLIRTNGRRVVHDAGVVVEGGNERRLKKTREEKARA